MLLADGRLVKTTGFSNEMYVGDPINAVRIFNEKQVDELVVLDTRASHRGSPPDYATVEEIVSEAFMPVAYGGGVSTVEIANRVIQLGVEKVVVNSAAVARPQLLNEIANRLGSSTLVVGIDGKARPDGSYEVMRLSGTSASGREVVEYARAAATAGAGEILLQSIDRDGTRIGYDLSLIRSVATSVAIPVVACGGAGSLDDIRAAIRAGGASAAAAGSLFVFHGRHRAVLMTYPSYEMRYRLFDESDGHRQVID